MFEHWWNKNCMNTFTENLYYYQILHIVISEAIDYLHLQIQKQTKKWKEVRRNPFVKLLSIWIKNKSDVTTWSILGMF